MFKIIISASILTLFSCSSIDPPIWKNDPRCGIKGPSHENQRIIGGVKASFGEFPWQAALASMYEDGDYDQEAGATIIHKQWVLITGFEAIFDIDTNTPSYPIEEINIWAGIVNVNDEVHKVVRNVSKRIIHPQRNFSTFGENNLALLKLDKELDFDHKGIKPICLPERQYDMTGKECSVAGWGEIRANVTNGFELNKVNDLQKVNVTVWSQQYCRHVWSNYKLTDLTVCASDYMKNTCWWDSGAALACYPSDNNLWFMHGMASHTNCGSPGEPALYANMYQYIPWIAKTIAEN